MTTERHRWAPGWPDHVIAKTQSIGFLTLTQLLDTLPACPYSEVCERLGGDFAPIQIVTAQLKEALASGRIRTAAKDNLCRRIVQVFPQGWGSGDNPDFQAAKALAMWSGDIKDVVDSSKIRAYLAAICDSFSPPLGWIPQDANDPIIESEFAEHWER